MLRWRRPLREAPARTCAEMVGSGGGAGARTEGGKESVRPQYDASGEALGGWAARAGPRLESGRPWQQTGGRRAAGAARGGRGAGVAGPAHLALLARPSTRAAARRAAHPGARGASPPPGGPPSPPPEGPRCLLSSPPPS